MVPGTKLFWYTRLYRSVTAQPQIVNSQVWRTYLCKYLWLSIIIRTAKSRSQVVLGTDIVNGLMLLLPHLIRIALSQYHTLLLLLALSEVSITRSATPYDCTA